MDLEIKKQKELKYWKSLEDDSSLLWWSNEPRTIVVCNEIRGREKSQDVLGDHGEIHFFFNLIFFFIPFCFRNPHR